MISLHAYGALIRLEDGRLAGASSEEVEKNRPAFERGLRTRKPLEFSLRAVAGHVRATLAPQVRDADLEQQIASYLKMTEEWEQPDAPPAHERRFLQKKRRAAVFQSRHAGDK
ncbi:MAG: hypothetical protein JOZ01_05900 [Candidatus Eremiobacteraeota bacterium]|nr:hypothetical protein [Candidatus Eremiobacteraeota bacterium]